MTTWKAALTRAITAEVTAEKAATQAEDERRRTWWATTWALAAVPRSDWGDAQAEYTKRTGHSVGYAKDRRTTGERLPQSRLGTTLPQPRFAQAVARWLGKSADEDKVLEAVKLLADAERSEQSLREFNQALTGKPWSSPENLTQADEDAVIEKVARTRPEVIAQQTQKPQVAEAVMESTQSRRSLLKGAQDVRRKRQTGKPMPTPQPVDPADVGEQPMTALDLQGFITEFHIMAGEAGDIRKAHELLGQILPVVSDEQRADLIEVADGVVDSWNLVKSVLQNPVTDEALNALIDEEAR